MKLSTLASERLVRALTENHDRIKRHGSVDLKPGSYTRRSGSVQKVVRVYAEDELLATVKTDA